MNEPASSGSRGRIALTAPVMMARLWRVAVPRVVRGQVRNHAVDAKSHVLSQGLLRNNVYTVGVGPICEKAVGELTTASAGNIRPATTPINRLFMHFSLAGQSVAQCNALEGRSSSLIRRFADGEGIRLSI